MDFFFFLWHTIHEQSLWLFSVISVSGTQIINNPWVCYSHIIPPMIKMLNQNMMQHRTQATGLGVKIARCSPDSQHGRLDHHPVNVDCFSFRYMNDNLRNHTNQRHKHKTRTREDNKLALHCYFRSNPLGRGYRKRMIEIRQECASFQTTSQRLANQVRTIIKKGWFSDLEIHQKINNEQDSNTIPDIPSINKQKQPNRKEPPTLENRNATQPNNQEQTLTQEQKLNLEN